MITYRIRMLDDDKCYSCESIIIQFWTLLNLKRLLLLFLNFERDEENYTAYQNKSNIIHVQLLHLLFEIVIL